MKSESIGKNVHIKLSSNLGKCKVEIDGVELIRVVGVKIEHNFYGLDQVPRLTIAIIPDEIVVDGGDVKLDRG